MVPRNGDRRAISCAAPVCVRLLPGGRLPATAPPWAEKAIRQHIDFTTLEGTLSADSSKSWSKPASSSSPRASPSTTALGRPMATQAIIPTKRKRPVDAPFRRTAGPDANNCSSCHNDPRARRRRRLHRQRLHLRGLRERRFRHARSAVLQRARHKSSLFGAGLVELLAREMTAELRAERHDRGEAGARERRAGTTVALSSKGVDFGKLTVMPDGIVDNSGIEGVDSDLTVRPFSQKGVFASLRQFTINAMNAHLGMEASERFGKRWTGIDDFDGTATRTSFRRATSPRSSPSRRHCRRRGRMVPTIPAGARPPPRGEKVFADLGCAACHRPTLPLEQPRLHRSRALRHGGDAQARARWRARRLRSRAARLGEDACRATTRASSSCRSSAT